MSGGFAKDTMTDQKRLVRAEHWIAARRILRARDRVHHRDWSLLVVAGPQPAEEITCIRELMPKARITAVDLDPQYVEAAKAAGADDAFVYDLAECGSAIGPFDVICLDLTGPADDRLARMIKFYWYNLAKNGAMIVTMCYGRDVVEMYCAEYEKAHRFDGGKVALEQIDGMPQQIKERLFYVLRNRGRHLRSCLQYRGKQMPMLSCLLQARHQPKWVGTFQRVDDGDYELAVTSEDLGNIYACPRERIDALRRSAIAKKAVQTRRGREAYSEPPHATASNGRGDLL